MNITLGKKKSDDEVHEPFVATLPRIDLLPPSVKEGQALRKTRNLLLLTFIAVVALGVLVWVMQSSAISEAEDRLATARAENEQIQVDIARLAPIGALFNQIESQKQLVQDTLNSQPRAAAVNNRLIQAGEETGGKQPVTFTSISVAYRPRPAPGDVPNPCPNPAPFDTQVAIGCLTFTATAESREQVAALLLAIEADPFFIGPYVGSTNFTGDVVSISGTTAVSTDALVTPLTQEEIDAILTPPAEGGES